ncbi:MAG: zinc ribbon domain-containing protein [Chloroflexi bacterium]|nr:MAG: zinc ribbon domain-containing protein [Phototrophicales bacterium]RMF76976.1 MAG: zinc ribbon domain-containing protein [Chloroflexota bacterium]
MPSLNIEGSTALLIAIVYVGVVIAASWFAMIIWSYRDMRARSRDSLAQAVVAIMVAVLTVPGLLIYIFLRPRETLSEAYERSLEEEALLQEIEDKPVCPTCRNHIHDDWQVCPHCHTHLKKACINCQRPLDLSWNICPHCSTTQANYRMDEHQHHQHIKPTVPVTTEWSPVTEPDFLSATTPKSSHQASSLEFVDTDDL